jgi:hypothetical protein
MAAKLTRQTHKIAIQLHLVAESCTIYSSHSTQPVRKLLDMPAYILPFTKKDTKSACFFPLKLTVINPYTFSIIYCRGVVWWSFYAFRGCQATKQHQTYVLLESRREAEETGAYYVASVRHKQLTSLWRSVDLWIILSSNPRLRKWIFNDFIKANWKLIHICSIKISS